MLIYQRLNALQTLKYYMECHQHDMTEIKKIYTIKKFIAFKLIHGKSLDLFIKVIVFLKIKKIPSNFRKNNDKDIYQH